MNNTDVAFSITKSCLMLYKNTFPQIQDTINSKTHQYLHATKKEKKMLPIIIIKCHQL